MAAESIPTQSIQKLLYDRKSAAIALSISVRTLDYLIARRSFRTTRIGRKILIPSEELRRFARANHYGPVAGEAAV
jgi:excisionase family DNA binding protein